METNLFNTELFKKITFDNFKEIMNELAGDLRGVKYTQEEKVLKLLQKGYGLSPLFATVFPISTCYLASVIRDIKKHNPELAIKTFKDKKDKAQTYYLTN